jgi:uncharacterized protein
VWKFQVYQDGRREYRWRLVAPNGLTIADSGEGYATRANARRAAENVRSRIAAATVADLH